MTNDALLVVEALFRTIFALFTSWYIPGTNVTPAVAFFGILFVVTFFRVFGKLFGAFETSQSHSKAEARRQSRQSRKGG